MHDLILARLIQEDREREIVRDQRARAAREAQSTCVRDGFIPPPPETGRPRRLRSSWGAAERA